jgi:hypothetical protein
MASGMTIDLFRLAIDEGRILQSSITGHPILANGEWQGLKAGEHDCSQEEFNAKIGADAFPHSADKRGW